MKHLFDLPHRETRALLQRGVPVYLPVNPVEYHGPHLSLHNDCLVSVGMATDLHARVVAALGDMPLLVADDLETGVEPCPGPGTRASPFTDVRRRVVDACERLADLGAERVVLVSFHGAPLHNLALHAGVEALRARGVRALAPLNLAMDDLVTGATEPIRDAFEAVPDPDLRARMFAGATRDFHAGFFETSMTLHYAPHTVDPRYRELPPCEGWPPHRGATRLARIARRLGRARLAAELDLLAAGLGWYAVRPFPGYTGHPALADPEAGRLFARAFTDRYAEHALAVFDGAEPARPVLPWLVRATLGGRVGAIHVEAEAITHHLD